MFSVGPGKVASLIHVKRGLPSQARVASINCVRIKRLCMPFRRHAFHEERPQLCQRPRIEHIALCEPSASRLCDTPSKIREPVATVSVGGHRYEHTRVFRRTTRRFVEVELLWLSIEFPAASPLCRVSNDPVEIEFHRITFEQEGGVPSDAQGSSYAAVQRP